MLKFEFEFELVAFAVLLVDFNRDFIWFDCFFGLAGGVFFGDFVARPLIERFDPRLFDAVLLIAPVFDWFGIAGDVLALKLFCRGGEQPK